MTGLGVGGQNPSYQINLPTATQMTTGSGVTTATQSTGVSPQSTAPSQPTAVYTATNPPPPNTTSTGVGPNGASTSGVNNPSVTKEGVESAPDVSNVAPAPTDEEYLKKLEAYNAIKNESSLQTSREAAIAEYQGYALGKGAPAGRYQSAILYKDGDQVFRGYVTIEVTHTEEGKIKIKVIDESPWVDLAMAMGIRKEDR